MKKKFVDVFSFGKLKDDLRVHGTYHFVHRDANGNIVDEWDAENLITDEGINYMLNSALVGATAISAWYMAPWSATHTPAAGDTYAVPGFTEANAEIAETTRQQWPAVTSTAKSVTNTTAVVLTAASAVTIYGIGIVGGGTAASTKGDTAGGGTLLSSAAFAASKTLAANETVSITYTLNGASA